MKRVPHHLKRGYCQRSGDRVPLDQLVREPGTDLLVSKEFNDGIYSRGPHDPRNLPVPPNPEEFRPRWYAEPDQFTTGKIGSTLAVSTTQLLNFGNIFVRIT